MTESIPPPRRLAINALIIVFFAIGVIHILPGSPLQNWLDEHTRALSNMMMINHHFNMFAELRDNNHHGEAYIAFQDGSQKVYDFYHVEQQDPFGKWLHGKMREFWADNLFVPATESLYPQIARYIARANRFPQNQPVRITLVQRWSPIPPMSQFIQMKDLPQDFNHVTLFEYDVRPEDVK